MKYNNSLKCKGSSGYVKMSNKIMWNTNYKPLSYISSKSVSVGICPMSQIYANVKPLYKKVGNPSMANYRPMFFFGDIFRNSWDNNVLQINHFCMYKLIMYCQLNRWIQEMTINLKCSIYTHI